VTPPTRSRLAAALGADPGPPLGPGYALRTASAAVIAYGLSRLTGPQIGIWSVVSAVVVIQPEAHATVSAAALRAVANVVGAVIGLAVGSALDAWPLLALAVGMLAVAAACRVLGIDAAARSASVSVAVVLLKDPDGVPGSSASRVAGVLAGCAIALAVTAISTVVEGRRAR